MRDKKTNMFLEVFHSKVHRATVTDANLHYQGSVTIDKTLLDAVGMYCHQKVQVVNISTGARIETYVIEGQPDSGVICLNGAAARHFQVGDLVIIMAYCFLTEEELKNHSAKTVVCDENNKIEDLKIMKTIN